MPRIKMSDMFIRKKMNYRRIELPDGAFFPIMTNLGNAALRNAHAKWLVKAKVLNQRSFVNWINLRSDLKWSASVLKSQIPKDHVRKIKAISNSGLTRLKAELEGKDLIYPARCMVFGSAFHEMVLEPHKFVLDEYNLRDSEVNALHDMKENLLSQSFLSRAVKECEMEKCFVWEDQDTGLLCKALIDMELRNNAILDIKTTSAWSREQFEESLTEFDYDRQTAFFLDGTGAKRMMIMGVQKRAPYKLFPCLFHRDSEFVENGRKKYKDLLAVIAERKINQVA